ncbi:hypothetical protein SUNI508_01692 [Seiridium unicorne]|uniref:DUF7924 domain-containing protein n=1 Tax=Seiridium unicorne TaxID=138068 RepID=A0ABR2UNQ9_9PEZI
MPRAILTRRNLEDNCIWIQPDFPFEYDDSPSHVQTLHDVVLDFTGTIQDRFNLQDDEDPWNVQQLPLWNKQGEQQSVIRNSIRTAEIAADKARELQSGKFLEGSWADYFNRKFFQPLYDTYQPTDEDSRSTSRQKYFFDSFESEREIPWNLFATKKGYRAKDRQYLTMPKVDRAFYFTVHDSKSTRGSAAYYQWRNSPQEKFIENFSYETLRHLSPHGLQSSPLDSNKLNSTLTNGGDSFRPSSLCCFPWLIIEHKKDDQRKADFCSWQAANASSAAVMLLQSAAHYAEEQDNCQHVPPVISITTVGEIVRVWITYFVGFGEQDEYVMSPIWEGRMTRVLDCLKLQVILENIHSWATRVLKPLISTYISHWRYQFPEESRPEDDPLEEFLEGRAQLASHQEKTLQSIVRRTHRSENAKLLGRVESFIEETLKNALQPPTPVRTVGTQTHDNFKSESTDFKAVTTTSILRKYASVHISSHERSEGKEQPFKTMAQGPIPGITTKTETQHDRKASSSDAEASTAALSLRYHTKVGIPQQKEKAEQPAAEPATTEQGGAKTATKSFTIKPEQGSTKSISSNDHDSVSKPHVDFLKTGWVFGGLPYPHQAPPTFEVKFSEAAVDWTRIFSSRGGSTADRETRLRATFSPSQSDESDGQTKS